MPRLPAAEISPASFPSLGLPGLSMAATSAVPALCWIARTTAVPIRPPAPQTIRLRFFAITWNEVEDLGGDLLNQAEVRQCAFKLLDIAVGHGRERQAQFGGAFTHQRGGGLHRYGVGFDKKAADQRSQLELQIAPFLPLTVKASFGQL